MAFEGVTHVLGSKDVVVPIENSGNSHEMFSFIHWNWLKKKIPEKDNKRKHNNGYFFFFLVTRADVSNR